MVKMIRGFEDKLVALGVPRDLLFGVRLPLVCAAMIRPSGEFFEFDDEGIGAVVIIEGERDSIGLDWVEMVDLVAFQTKDPKRWWRRYGEARWLGQDAIEYGAERWPDEDAPRILRTPLDWLRAGADRCAVPLLEDAVYDLARLPSFTVADAAHGYEIAEKLKAFATARLPTIGVDYAERAAA